jgi:hypothetical protein
LDRKFRNYVTNNTFNEQMEGKVNLDKLDDLAGQLGDLKENTL